MTPSGRSLTRREFGTIATTALASVSGSACQLARQTGVGSDGRLTVGRPGSVATSNPNTRALGLEPGRDAILRMPSGAGPAPVPLIVLLHGAGGSGEGVLGRLGAAADAAGVAALAPDSRGSTWDAIRGGFGRDVAFLSRALLHVFETTAVDPARVAIGGFSDGATYAISLGLINGDLFPRIVAFSPGFVVAGPLHGQPQLFVSHGTSDPILPIDRCSRVIVSALRQRQYQVTYREFNGGHEVPRAIADEGMRWVASA